MSFDLTFWYEKEPSTDEDAARIYDQLTDGELGIVEPSPTIDAFFAEVDATYPDLTDDDTDDDRSPWSSPLYRNAECVIAAISWSRRAEVEPRLIEMAARHGLTAYDPQNRVTHHPS